MWKGQETRFGVSGNARWIGLYSGLMTVMVIIPLT